MAKVIKVVGAGPGDPEYLTEKAKLAIAEAQILAGGKRLLQQFALPAQATLSIDRNLEAFIEKLKQVYQDQQVTVLAAGDPGFYGILATLRKHFPAQQLEVIPGISSVQLAFARIGESWHDSKLVSLHGRDWSEVDTALTEKKIALLTDGVHHPAAIAQYLVNRGFSNAKVYLCSNLSYETERVEEMSMKQLLQLESKDPAVVVVIRE